ncbi:MAG: PKD domain-containing protein [Saprospiraceae bacterium]
MKKYFLLTFVAIASLFTACKPEVDDKIELPAPPTPSFSVAPGKDANHLLLSNSTAGAFMFQWDLGNGTKSDQASVEAYYPFKGEFEVTLVAFNKGGYGTTKQKVTINQDDPNSCSGIVALLSDCKEKVWKLKPAAGSMTVGTPGLTTVYWANSDKDVLERACHFNDEFKFTSKGVFEYDNKGDFWGDADGNGNIIPAGSGIPLGCNPSSAWKAPYTVWGSGKHKYNATADKLILTGEGAWMGLYKIGTSAEVGTPQQSVEFKIIEVSKTKLVIAAVYAALEWRFTYEAK